MSEIIPDPSIHFGTLNFLYDGTAKPATIYTNSTDWVIESSTIYYNGSTTVPVNAGTYFVYATARVAISGAVPLIRPSGGIVQIVNCSGNLIISPLNATVTLNGPFSVQYDGSPHSLSATTSPAGLATSITYNGSTTVPSAVGHYTVIASIADSNYSGSQTSDFSITPAYNNSGAYYNNALGDGNFQTAGNWWSDSAHTIPAGGSPSNNSIVYIDGNVSSGWVDIFPKAIFGKYSANPIAIWMYNQGGNALQGSSSLAYGAEFWNGAYIGDNGQASGDPAFAGNVLVNYPCPIPMPNLGVTSGYSITYSGYPYAVAVNNQEIAFNTIWVDANAHGAATWSATAPAGGNVSQQNSTSTGWVKEGDDLLLNVAFHSTTSFSDPQITQISVTFVDPSSGSVVLNSSNFVPMVGTNQGTPASGIYTPDGYFSYLFWISVTSSPLSQLLGDYKDGVNESVNLIGEVKWTEVNTSGVGPLTLTQRSQNFTLIVARTLNEAANFQPL